MLSNVLKKALGIKPRAVRRLNLGIDYQATQVRKVLEAGGQRLIVAVRG